jgi:hypothetical protein
VLLFVVFIKYAEIGARYLFPGHGYLAQTEYRDLQLFKKSVKLADFG